MATIDYTNKDLYPYGRGGITNPTVEQGGNNFYYAPQTPGQVNPYIAPKSPSQDLTNVANTPTATTPSSSQPVGVISSTSAKEQTTTDLNDLGSIQQQLEAIRQQALKIKSQYEASKTETTTEPTPTTNTYGVTPEEQSRYSDLEKQLSDINTKYQSQADADVNSLRQSVADLKSSNTRLVDSIRANYDTLINEQKRVNDAILGGITKAGIRAGISRYAPELADQKITSEMTAGIQRISKLTGERDSLIAQAEIAASKEEYDQLYKIMGMARQNQQDRITALLDVYKQSQDLAKNAMERSKLAMEQQEAEVNMSTKKAEAIAPYILDYLTGDEDTDTALLQKIADAQGYDVSYLLGQVSKSQLERQKLSVTEDIKNFNFAKSQGYQGDFNQWQRDEANRKAVAGGGGLTPKNVLDYQTNLRKEFNTLPEVKDFNEIKRSITAINTGYNQALGAGADKTSKAAADQVLVVAFNKMIDPGSVVREGEFARSTQGQSLLNRLYGKVQGWVSGGVGLTDGDRKQILDVSKQLYDDYLKLFNTRADEYRGYAQSYGVNPDLVVKQPTQTFTSNYKNITYSFPTLEAKVKFDEALGIIK